MLNTGSSSTKVLWVCKIKSGFIDAPIVLLCVETKTGICLEISCRTVFILLFKNILSKEDSGSSIRSRSYLSESSIFLRKLYSARCPPETGFKSLFNISICILTKYFTKSACSKTSLFLKLVGSQMGDHKI